MFALKVSIIGAGHVGTTVAFSLVVKGICDEIVIINRTFRKAEGEAADLQHASAFTHRAMTIRAGEEEDSKDSDVVILSLSVTLGQKWKSRNELAAGNAELLRAKVPKLVELSPNAIFIVVTNPVDSMTYLTWKLSGLPASQVIGSGTLIDSARFRSYLSQHMKIHPEDIRAYVLGEHGETQFPALSVSATGGQRLDRDPEIERLFKKTVSSALEIFEIKGYTNYAVALATELIVESVLNDSHRTLPVSTLIQGFQGQHDVCLSIPSVIGRKGVIRQLNPQFSEEEVELFRISADAVRSVIAQVI